MKLRLFIIATCLLSFGAKAQTHFPSFADLSEKLLPMVVNISTLQNVETLDVKASTGDDMYSPSNDRVALGSGFIIDTRGYILTNLHVIENAKVINVVLFDNTEVEAKVIGGDEKTDIALIKIDPPFELDKVEFGNSDELRIGDWVLAIGNPFGLGGSVSAGIVSAKSRDIAAGPYDNFIQTDASINQGSSGGPMFNTQGQVVGVNTAIFSTSGNNQGVGFAVPINLVGWIVRQLEQNGEVQRGWLGLKIQQNSKEIARELNLKENQGVVVSAITEDGPADKAGVKVGDIIINLGRLEITNTKDFSRLIAETQAGVDVQLLIMRNNEIVPITVKVGDMPKAPNLSMSKETEGVLYEADQVSQELGIRVMVVDFDIINTYSLSPSTMGLMVMSVEANSDAALKGLKKGDIILKMDKKDVISINDALEQIDAAKKENNRQIMMLIEPQEQDNVNLVSIKLKNR